MALYKVIVERDFEADFKSVPFPIRRQINHRIMKLKDDPRSSGAEELSEPTYRLSMYGWQIVFDINDPDMTVTLLFLHKD